MRARLGAVIAVLLLAPFAFAADRLVIADSDGKAVVILDFASGKVLSSLPLQDPPSQVLATADGKRLVAISRGPGNVSWVGTFHPTGKASATVIDGESMKVLARIELGWDATDAQITKDGRWLMVLSPGVDAEGGEERFGSVHVVDLTNAAAVRSFSLDRPAQGALLSGDQKQVVIYSQGSPGKRPTLLRFLDLEAKDSPPIDVTIQAKTRAPAAFEGHDFIYLLDPPMRREGTLHVISASQHKLVASHPVGRNAVLGAFDDPSGRLFVLSMGIGEGQPGGRLDVFKDGQAFGAPKPIVSGPRRMTFTPDRKEAIIGGNETQILSLDGTEPDSVMKAGTPYETWFTPDMKRAFFYYWSESACCYVGVIDYSKREPMKHFLIGSKAVRFGQALVAGLLSAGSYATAASAARGSSSFYYTVYTPAVARAGRGMMVVRSDGKFAYALDPQTDYVTRIDSESGERLEGIKVGGGSRQLVPLHDNAVITVMSARAVTFIDTATQQKSGELTFAGELYGVETNADGTRGVALAHGKVVIFDGTGKTVAEVTTVQKPIRWIFF